MCKKLNKNKLSYKKYKIKTFVFARQIAFLVKKKEFYLLYLLIIIFELLSNFLIRRGFVEACRYRKYVAESDVIILR